MQILLIMLIVVLLAFSVLLLALAKQSPREKQTEDKEQEEYIRDYAETVRQAVSLVLQAGTYAKGGEIFVLDMGAPVKIDTLARNLIKLSGYTPDVDIKVTYTGLRPGEKLYEEKLMAEEGMEKTPNDLIHIGKPIEMDVQEFFKQLEVLAAYGYANSEKIRDIVAAIVPTYHSADSDLKLHKKVYEELMSEAAVAAEKN